MADISYIDRYFSHQEISDNEERWLEFFKSEMSSIYQDRDIHSGHYSVLLRTFSKLIAGIDLLFDKYDQNVVLDSAMYESLYTNFGFLLDSKSPSFSNQEYRIFLINLLNILFKGFTINNSKNSFITGLLYADIEVELVDSIPNSSLYSKGLSHANSLLTTTGEFGFYLDHNHELSNFFSSKDINDMRVTLKVGEDGRFYIKELEIIYKIVKTISSAISQPDAKILFDDSNMVTQESTTHSLCLFESYNNFKTVISDVCFDGDGLKTVNVMTEFYLSDDSYSISNLSESFDSYANYGYTVKHNYHAIEVDSENPSRIGEAVYISGLCFPYQEGLLFGGPQTFGGVYYDPRCMLTVPPYCELGTEPFYYDHMGFYNDDGENRYGQLFRPSECENPDNHYELEVLPVYRNDTGSYAWLNGGDTNIRYGDFTYGKGPIFSTEGNTEVHLDCQIVYTLEHTFEHPLNEDTEICYYAKVYNPDSVVDNIDVGGDMEDYNVIIVDDFIVG